ncbi:SMI1/KNR4 family protein [Saccharopolyspora sp. MS10]|uniref:SMI1/KNR4 family protein n=1 Tax=Saccharopolyspora sp. MS10 TaxID=3385973 RepID=UPI00399FC0E9
MTPAPSTSAQWREFLVRRGAGTPGVEDWRGHGPAGAAAVAGLEERLGRALPPSYRNFLLVSDGWSDPGTELCGLLATPGIGWFEDVAGDLVEAWDEPEVACFAADLAMLRRSLLVSDHGNGVFWLLNPNEVAGNGEWAAYEWDTGSGSPARHADFAALVAAALAER